MVQCRFALRSPGMRMSPDGSSVITAENTGAYPDH